MTEDKNKRDETGRLAENSETAMESSGDQNAAEAALGEQKTVVEQTGDSKDPGGVTSDNNSVEEDPAALSTADFGKLPSRPASEIFTRGVEGTVREALFFGGA